MSVPARCAAWLSILGLVLGLALAGPAGAAPYTQAASISVSQSAPCHGVPLTVTGTGFTAGETVVLRIGNTVIGRVKAGADGTITARVTVLDALRGLQTIIAAGRTSGRTATTVMTVGACGDGSTAPGSAGAAPTDAAGGNGAAPDSGGRGGLTGNGAAPDSGGRGGLSSTGVAVLSLLGIAVAFVAFGAVLLLGGRRRHSRAARTA